MTFVLALESSASSKVSIKVGALEARIAKGSSSHGCITAHLDLDAPELRVTNVQ